MVKIVKKYLFKYTFLYTLWFFIGLWEEANDHLNEAKNIFEVMFGDNHPIVTEKCHNIQIQIDQKSPTLTLAPSLESVQDLNF